MCINLELNFTRASFRRLETHWLTTSASGRIGPRYGLVEQQFRYAVVMRLTLLSRGEAREGDPFAARGVRADRPTGSGAPAHDRWLANAAAG
jgi:hypothetical protein